MNNKSLGKILIGMGIITFITTIIDYYALAIPINIKSKEWVFSVTQSISDLSIMPVLGMIFLLLGLHLIREKTNENIVNNIEKVTGILSVIFAVGFAGCALMYSISVGGVEKNIVDSLKANNEAAKVKLNTIYDQYKARVDQEKFDMVVENLDEQMMVKINQANSNLTKATFKTILTLIFFSLLHLYIFLKIFALIDFIKYRILKLKKRPVKE